MCRDIVFKKVFRINDNGKQHNRRGNKRYVEAFSPKKIKVYRTAILPTALSGSENYQCNKTLREERVLKCLNTNYYLELYPVNIIGVII